MRTSTFSDGFEKENFQRQIHPHLGTHNNRKSQDDEKIGTESSLNPLNDKERPIQDETVCNMFNETDFHEESKNMGELNDGIKLAPTLNFNQKECQLKNWESFWCNTEGYKTKHIQPFHFTSGLEEIKEPVMELNISTSPYKGQRPNSAPTECSAATTTVTKTQLEVSFLKTNLLTYIKKEIDICLTSIPFSDDAVQMQKKFLEYRDMELDEEYELKILGELLNELNFFHMEENSLLNREIAIRKISNQPENQKALSTRGFRHSFIPINNLHSPPRVLKKNGKSFEESYEFASNSSNFWGEKAKFQNSIGGGTPYCFHANNIYQTTSFTPFENQNEPSFENTNPDHRQHFNSGRSIQNGVDGRSYKGIGLHDSYEKGYTAMAKSFGNIDLNRMPRRGNEEMYSWSRN